MVILDANMVLRYLLNDNPDMADAAERYIDSGDANVTTEVIAEVVYVLKGVYSLDRVRIAGTIKGFLELVGCPDFEVLEIALDTYSKTSLDFVDCVLYGYHYVRGAVIATFDRKLIRLISDS